MVDGVRLAAETRTENAPPARLLFDFTTTALWSGPHAGIVRVEGEFARWALDHVNGLVLAFFDPATRAFRPIRHDVARRLIAQDATLDTISFVDLARRGRRKTDRIPPLIRPALMWILQSRRMALRALERKRLRTGNVRIAGLVDRLQRVIMSPRYRAILVKPDGSRRACFPIDMVLGVPLELSTRDTLVCAGAGWTHDDIGAIVAAKRKIGFRFVLFCHDIIPLMFPQYHIRPDVEALRQYCGLAFPAADVVIFSSRTVAADVRAYCGAHGLALGNTAVCSLGAHIRVPVAAGPLPAGLEPGRYALLVSTIEPRKGHRLIYNVWVKLLAAGIPQRARFRLVFAGRAGWMVGDLMQELQSDPRIAGTLVMFTEADDAKLAALYRDAAFCLYPSRYEGFGLPAVEAFRNGKAVIASTGGAVPEVVGDFSPCLDPDDAEAWLRMLQTWIEEPAARVVYEERIRTRFHHPDWDESAQAFFALACGAARPSNSGRRPC
jgi:glycosyltransferase involved in cell wall biosynthesis